LNSNKPILGPEASAALRDRLLTELNNLGSGDDAATWAHRCLGEKNKLLEADARQVEDAFQGRLAHLTMGDSESRQTLEAELQTPYPQDPGKPKHRPRSEGIDKSLLAWSEPRRVGDRNHVRTVTQHPCLICGRRPSDAHHLRFAQSRALGRKVSDEYAVPLCRGHHRAVHHCGDEAAWWQNAGVDPTIAARATSDEAQRHSLVSVLSGQAIATEKLRICALRSRCWGSRLSLDYSRCIDNVGTMTTMFDGRMWLCQHLLDAKMM
jgi:hypothetical protein